MTPKAIIEVFKAATSIQRLAVGLSNTPGKQEQEQTPAGASIELILRDIAHKTRQAEVIDGEAVDITDNSAIDLALQDPETAALAQELVLKLQVGGGGSGSG